MSYDISLLSCSELSEYAGSKNAAEVLIVEDHADISGSLKLLIGCGAMKPALRTTALKGVKWRATKSRI